MYVFSAITCVVKQGVALTGRNTTGPPCSCGAIIRLEAARRHLLLTTDDDNRRRQTPASVTSLAPTLCVGGPVIKVCVCVSASIFQFTIYVTCRWPIAE